MCLCVLLLTFQSISKSSINHRQTKTFLINWLICLFVFFHLNPIVYLFVFVWCVIVFRHWRWFNVSVVLILFVRHFNSIQNVFVRMITFCFSPYQHNHHQHIISELNWMNELIGVCEHKKPLYYLYFKMLRIYLILFLGIISYYYY